MIIREQLNNKGCANKNAKHIAIWEHLVCGKISLHISGPDMLYSDVERLNYVQMILFKTAEIQAVNCKLKLFRTLPYNFSGVAMKLCRQLTALHKHFMASFTNIFRNILTIDCKLQDRQLKFANQAYINCIGDVGRQGV